MSKQRYNHKEAFCLMLYKCEKCGRSETLWNSRDGVTPFIIRCRHCNGEARHINWFMDECKPNHKPKPGQRIFVDMTKEKAKEVALSIIKRSDRVASEESLNNLIESIWHNGETPDIITVE